MRKFVTLSMLAAFCAVSYSFPQNDTLRNLPEKGFLNLGARISSSAQTGSGGVLEFSGMTYDSDRHRILAFGGGHSTMYFPNEVMEFHIDSLMWRPVTLRDHCSLFVAANSLTNSEGIKLGGIRLGNHVAPGSRHSYDALVVVPGMKKLFVLQGQESIGGSESLCGAAFRNDYATYFHGGEGLWSLDLDSMKWSVRDEAHLAISRTGTISAVDPSDPDWIYQSNSGSPTFRKLNWRTGQIVGLSAKTGFSADMSMEYCPDRNSILLFPDDGNVREYDIAKNAWTTRNPAGEKPNCYSHNVVYDTLQHVFACFSSTDNKLDSNYRFFYYNPGHNEWYHLDDTVRLKRLFHHHIYDPVNNVHLMTGGGWCTYVFKFSDTAGKFPGTIGTTSRLETRHSGAQAPELWVNPNPANPSATIRVQPKGYGGQNASDYTQSPEVRIYDCQGRITASLTRHPAARREGTRYEFHWDGKGADGKDAASGIYLVRVEWNGALTQTRLTLMR